MSTAFGHHLRHLRTQHGWSLRLLAAKAHVDPGYLSRVENGRRHPTIDMAVTLDTTLHAQGTLILLAEHREADTHRRQILHGIGAAGLVVAGLPLPTRPATDIPRRIGMGHVHDLDQATTMYRAWVARHGGATIRTQVDTLLDQACRMYTATTDRQVRSALLRSVADLAGLDAYIARDVGAHSDAQAAFQIALTAATASRATALRAHTIVRMAGHHLELRQPTAVLNLLTAARPRTGHLAEATEANRCCLAAWGHAQAGHVQAVHRAVGQAEEHQAATTGRAAGWAAQHVTEAELYSLTGAAYVDLARIDRAHAATAIDRLTRAIDLRGPSAARNRCLDLLSLSEVLLITGQADEAGSAALRAHQTRSQVASSRLDLRIRALRRELGAHAGRSETVAAFLAATRPASASVR